MKNKSIRLIAFMAAFVLVLVLANTFFIQMDSVTAITMHELKSRSDIELALVGSSIVQYHFDPAIIEARTGLETFSVAFNNIALQGSAAVTKELFRTNSPQWVVLGLDHYTIRTAKEDTKAEYRIMPLLTDWRTKLDYYLSLCREDGAYIDRFFIFREFGVTSPSDVIKNIALRVDPKKAFDRLKEAIGPDFLYMGDGYLRSLATTTGENAIRTKAIRYETPGYDYSLLPPVERLLLEYKALCEKHGAKLMIVVPPNHTANMLFEAEALPYLESLARFCEDNGIPYFNFTYARPELLVRMDPYFFDMYHFGGEGADLFSEAFSRVFNMYLAGEDTGSLFYENASQYMQTVDFITNVWFTLDEQTHTFTADCNRGPDVTAEYRYTLLGEDGAEELLRDYDEDRTFTFDVPQGRSLRVYARVKGDGHGESVHYDYPSDYAVHFGD